MLMFAVLSENVMNKKITFDPIKSVMSPLWIFALGILILNDHLLKAEWSNAFTGKLSDFAGLFLAPVLFALVLGVKTKRGLYLSGLAVGVVFSAINLFPSAASFWDGTLSIIYPYSTTVDPTDLIALIMIPIGISYFESYRVNRRTRNIFMGRTLALVGVGASLASSNPPGEPFVPLESSQVSIYNQSNELHILRIRNLEPNFRLDCDAVSKAPEDYLDATFFGEPFEWLVQSGQQIPITSSEVVTETKRCDAALVESETLPDVIVFWTSELEVKSFPFDFEIPRTIAPDPQTLVIHADYPEGTEDFHEWRFRTECGSRADLCDRATLVEAAEIPEGASYFWESDSPIGELHHPKPSSLDRRRQDPTEECAAPTAEAGVFWEELGRLDNLSDLRVIDIREGIDGCHELFLSSEFHESEFGFLICVPFESIAELKPTEELPFVALSFSEESTSAHTSLLLRAVYYDDADGQNFSTVRSIYVTRGDIPPQIDFEFEERPRLECVPQIQNCGVTLPLDLEVDGEVLKPGESTTVGSVIKREIYLVRSEFLPVAADVCGDLGQNETYLETVVITE